MQVTYEFGQMMVLGLLVSLGVLLAVSLVALAVGALADRHRNRTARARACRSFADAVAAGDYELADGIASASLREHDRPVAERRTGGSRPVQGAQR
jgi:hypothetical protein